MTCPINETTRPRDPSSILKVEVVRFGMVTALSLGLDLAVARSLATLVGFSLGVSVTAGFLAGATFNYIVHELWTFPGASGRLSLRGWSTYVGAVGLVLGLRLIVIWGLEGLASDRTNGTLPVLLVACLISFAVNFVLSKLFLFRSSAE